MNDERDKNRGDGRPFDEADTQDVEVMRRDPCGLDLDDPETAELCIRALPYDKTSTRVVEAYLRNTVHACACLTMLGRCNVRQEIDEVYQHVWLKLIEDGALDGWNRSKGRSLKNYIWVRTRWIVIDWLRNTGRQADILKLSSDVRSGSCAIDELLVDRRLRKQLLKYVKKTQSRRALRIFILLVVLEYTYAEVASYTGLKLNAVHWWVHKLRRVVESFLALSPEDPVS